MFICCCLSLSWIILQEGNNCVQAYWVLHPLVLFWCIPDSTLSRSNSVQNTQNIDLVAAVEISSSSSVDNSALNTESNTLIP